jgi:hypothetical protein
MFRSLQDSTLWWLRTAEGNLFAYTDFEGLQIRLNAVKADC